MSRVESGHQPRSFGRGSLQVPEFAGTVATAIRNQGGWSAGLCFLRRALAPHLLVLLDPLVPAPLANTRLKVGRHLRDVLALAHHAASHLVAVSIDCREG
jgi:hypothetical protein